LRGVFIFKRKQSKDMYAIIPQQIPQDKRAEVNEKILFAIDSGKDLIPAESIYNCYTGIGGLHNLKQSDFANYNEYANAKKEFEMGQFFTPHEVCRDMVEMLSPVYSEMILDMCCGMGNFFNHLPNLHNAYGFDIDGKAVTVARYLYPEARIEKCDIRQYHPEQRFDVIIGNPPFNLKFDYKLSQEYYMNKAYDVLNPAGILMVIVPLSFMQSEFWEKSRVANINSDFSFVGQVQLDPNAFASTGVHNFRTKVMVFLRESRHIEMQPYNAEEFISMDELKGRIMEARAMKHKLRLDLMRETNRIDREELELFEYKLAKYMYELKAHAALNRHIDKAEALVTKFRNQKPPENATKEQEKEWERKKLTTKKVLGIIRRYITSQNIVPRKEVALVKTSYGFRLKQYAPRLLDKVQHKAAGINDLVLGRAELPVPEILTEKNMMQVRAAKKLIRKKRRQYEIQNRPFSDMKPDTQLAEYLDRTTFINKEGDVCEFTELQKHDLNLVLQKRFALLNWQQGSGKTAAVYHRAKYLLKYRKVRNVIILAPAIATNMTWVPFLTINRERFRMVRNNADLETVPEGVFLVLSTSMLGKLKRGLTKFIRRTSRKLCLVFDESDEITNPSSQRTRHILGIFRRLKYKILDTGTTTRNNIAELYSQFELLYNNSINMICWCSRIYHENRDREIEEDPNPHYGEPFPAFRGHVLFRACHCPGKVAVGCTSIAAFELYENLIRERFPDRPVFTVKGDVAFKKRQGIVSEFDSTINGILVCTQQSLSSSVNIPSCNDVILESLQWNIPKMEQFYFRFIRLDSKELKNVHFVTYKDSVEQNLMALVLTKERLNEFIKTGEVKEQSEIFEEFDVTMSVIDSLLVRERDSEGKIHISWGSQRIMS